MKELYRMMFFPIWRLQKVAENMTNCRVFSFKFYLC